MELAVPFIALGALYVINNHSVKKEIVEPLNNKKSKEGFQTSGQNPNYLPNKTFIASNYPTTNNKELVDNVNYYPNPNQATDKYFDQNLYETEQNKGVRVGENIQEIYSLTGNYLNSKEFKHSNMKPFYGSKIKGQIYKNNNAENMLDNLVGNGSQTIKKIEQAPLFKPENNVQYPHGTPNWSDFLQSRTVPGTKNNSVKPFESIRVGPGLNQGYTNEGSNGFNSGMEARNIWVDKTVDELRIKTNPKQEYSQVGLEGPAQSYVKSLGSIGKVEKYNPDGFFINSQDRWLTTTGAEKAGQLLPKQIIHDSNRNQTTTHYSGVASSAHKNASYNSGVYEEPKRAELSSIDVPISTASGRGPIENLDTLGSMTNLNNNRSSNVQPDTFRSGFNSAMGAAIAPLLDIFKPTKKSETCTGVTVYGDAGKTVSNNYVINPKDTPKITNKETTIFKPHGWIGSQRTDASYSKNTNTPVPQQRDTTSVYDVGNMGGDGNKYGAMDYDAYFKQHNNDNKQTMEFTNQGNMDLYNHDINVQINKQDTCTDSVNRLQAPKNLWGVPPSVETYGKFNAPQYYNECEIGCTRIEPEILNAFRSNPYTFSLTNTA
jgi:hypothetical protein